MSVIQRTPYVKYLKNNGMGGAAEVYLEKPLPDFEDVPPDVRGNPDVLVVIEDLPAQPELTPAEQAEKQAAIEAAAAAYMKEWAERQKTDQAAAAKKRRKTEGTA